MDQAHGDRIPREHSRREPEVALRYPLRPDAYHGLTARKMTVHFELTSAHPIKQFEVLSKTLP